MKNSTDRSAENQIECQAQKFAIFVTLKSEIHETRNTPKCKGTDF